jgi:type III secretory pathway component EscS
MNTHHFAIVQAIAYDQTLDFKKKILEFFSTLDQKSFEFVEKLYTFTQFLNLNL